MLRTLVFSGLLVSCLAAGQFSYQDCTRNDTNRLGRLENINLAVHPVRFPGNETGSIDIVILRPITGNNLQLSVHIQKKVFMGFVDVPCLTTVDPPVGSCDYDLCGILAGLPYASDPHHCPKQIADTSPDFQCACPFQPGTYSLNPTTVFITEPNGAFKFAAQGDYRAKITIVDKANGNEEVGCYVFYVSTETNCDGISCIIG